MKGANNDLYFYENILCRPQMSACGLCDGYIMPSFKHSIDAK